MLSLWVGVSLPLKSTGTGWVTEYVGEILAG